MRFTRRRLLQGISAAAAGIALPSAVAVINANPLPSFGNGLLGTVPDGPSSIAIDPASSESVSQADRTCISLADAIHPLPFGVWVGLGCCKAGHNPKEADYYGYQRQCISSGSPVVGQGGFYRILTDIRFPSRVGGSVVADSLLIFETDHIDPASVMPVAAFNLPARIIARAKQDITLRDVSLDLNFGLGSGDWRDDPDIAAARVRDYFKRID